MKERKLYITKVDKGGCILILNANDVEILIQETLNDKERFAELRKDPRDLIKKIIKRAVCRYQKKNLLSQDDVFHIT